MSMSRSRARWLAGAVAGSCLLLTAVGAAAAAAVGVSAGDAELVTWPANAALLACGWVLATRVRHNPVGWLLLMIGVGYTVNLPCAVLAVWLIQHGAVGLGRWIGAASDASWVLGVGGLGLLLPLVFPDGRLPSRRRRWRVVLWADLAYLLLASVNLFQAGRLVLPG
jgi:hypothetical protein